MCMEIRESLRCYKLALSVPYPLQQPKRTCPIRHKARLPYAIIPLGFHPLRMFHASQERQRLCEPISKSFPAIQEKGRYQKTVVISFLAQAVLQNLDF